MSIGLASVLLVIGILILISSIDDLVIDILASIKLGRDQISPLHPDETRIEHKPSIAIFVANWHEANVLGKMVEGNLENFTYEKVRFVLGVYPNDPETLAVVQELAKKHPRFVEVVVNPCSGPTSKGQMLNVMFQQIFGRAERSPDLVVLHDSEDIIAPLSFEVYARHAAAHAMIQIPVFSLDSRKRSLVSATYMEEFAERHTREMILREELGAFVPSAGVGTCLRKDLIEHFLATRGYVLEPGSVTEDYVLGAESHRQGFAATFAAYRDPRVPSHPIIATFEYFPKEFWAAVKQRGRWVYGICFDGTKRLGWSGSFWQKFFLYRDRKGAWANLLPVVSLLILLICLTIGIDRTHVPAWQVHMLQFVLTVNTISIFLRIYFKTQALRQIYGTHDFFGLIIRWPVAFVINAIATARAWRTFFVESRMASQPIIWAKTQHELPEVFRIIDAAEIRAPKIASLPRRSSPAAAILRTFEGSESHIGNRLSVACNAAVVVLMGAYLYYHQTTAIELRTRVQTAAVNSLRIARERDAEQLSLATRMRSSSSKMADAPPGFRPFPQDRIGYDRTAIRASVERSLVKSATADAIVLAMATPSTRQNRTAYGATTAFSEPDARPEPAQEAVVSKADEAAMERREAETARDAHNSAAAELARLAGADKMVIAAARPMPAQEQKPEVVAVTEESTAAAQSEATEEIAATDSTPQIREARGRASAGRRHHRGAIKKRPKPKSVGTSTTFLRGGGCGSGSCGPFYP